MWYFQIFFFLLIALFTVLQRILKMDFGGLPDVPSGSALFIESFENSIGNINNPNYLKLTVGKDLSQFMANIQLFTIWTVWFLNQYVILVVMLNFLISVISDTYAGVQERSKMHLYRYRSQLNIEFLEIRDLFFAPKQISCLINVTSNETYNVEPEQIEEFQVEVDKIIRNNHSETKERIDKMEENITQKMDERMMKMEN